MSLPLIIITGASSGIGEAAAKAFAELGHPLLLLARRLDRMEAMQLPNAICKQVDVTDADAVAAAIAEAEAAHGPADCIVNNAGVMLLGQVAEQDPNQWRSMFDVNVMGLLNGIKPVLGGMISRKRGTIINISSIAGIKTFPNHAVYCGTKFAVHAITEGIREEVAATDVRLCIISPGVTETELLGHTTNPDIIKEYEDWKASIDGGIASEDIARAIVYTYQQPQNVCVRDMVICPTRQGP